MKCEKCPYYTVEGVDKDMDWCDLYNAGAPVEGCEGERDSLMEQQKLMQDYFKRIQEE